MRITGGTCRGRRLQVPRTTVRPTQDRVREALFSMIGPSIEGCRFLDLFAGSGAVGLEAWSRGAADVCWVEADRNVIRHLRQNVSTLCGAGGNVIAQDVESWLSAVRAGTAFDIVYADPPYGAPSRRAGQGSMLAGLMEQLDATGIVAQPSGFVILEQDADEPLIDPPAGWELRRHREYGRTRLVFIHRQA